MRPVLLCAMLAVCVSIASAQLVPVTAVELEPDALAKAQSELQSDAVLTNIIFAQIQYSGVTTSIDMQTGKATGWVYRFYSPSLDSSIFYIAVKLPIVGGQIVQPPLGTSIPIPQIPGNIEFTAPWVDSPLAIAGALMGGASVFLTAHPNAVIDLMIALNNPIENPLAPKGKYWIVRFVDGQDNYTCAVNAETSIALRCGTVNAVAALPVDRGFQLRGISPQPLSLSSPVRMSIAWNIDTRQHIRIRFFDLEGRVVHTAEDADVEAGAHSITVGRDVFQVPGVYFMRIEIRDGALVRPVIVIQ